MVALMSFGRWIRSQKNREDGVGALARFVVGSDTWPKQLKLDQVLEYVPAEHRNALSVAMTEYRRYVWSGMRKCQK